MIDLANLTCPTCHYNRLNEIPPTYGRWEGDEFLLELRDGLTVQCLYCMTFLTVLRTSHGAWVRFEEKNLVR